jgi:hypothetical protein
MFWLAYLFTLIVGGTFAVILRVLRKVLRSWGRLRIRNQKRAPQRIAEHLPTSRYESDTCYIYPAFAIRSDEHDTSARER